MSLAAKLGRLLLAAALLAGWQSALLHPIEHVDEHGAFVHAGSGHHAQRGDHGHESGKASVLCDAIAALSAVVGSAGASAMADAPGQGATATPVLLARGNAPLEPSSRGPPTLL